MDSPLISVVMPVYNAEKYIRKAVESILNQTEEDFELLIVDDCGIDNSINIVREMNDSRIKILSNDINRGIAFSRNKAIDNARGRYIALMDDDDIAPLDRFKIEKNFLEENQDIDIVGGQMIWINENDQQVTFPNQILCNPNCVWAELLFMDVIANGSTMLRTELIKKNNLRYKDGFLGMEDYKFWTECSVVGKIVNLNQVLLYWRNIQGNETHRTQTEFMNEKMKKYSLIQKEALKMNGFQLEEEEYEIFCKSFCINRKQFISIKELKEARDVLKKLISQVKVLYVDRSQEFEFICHRMLGRKTENSEIWQ